MIFLRQSCFQGFLVLHLDKGGTRDWLDSVKTKRQIFMVFFVFLCMCFLLATFCTIQCIYPRIIVNMGSWTQILIVIEHMERKSIFLSPYLPFFMPSFSHQILNKLVGNTRYSHILLDCYHGLDVLSVALKYLIFRSLRGERLDRDVFS